MNLDNCSINTSSSNLSDDGAPVPEAVVVQRIPNMSLDARPPMNQEEFDARYGYQRPVRKHGPIARQCGKFLRQYYRPFLSLENFHRTLIGFLPILDWLPKYSLRENFTGDLIGGLTVGVMNVPQGIAYAVLANVDPVVGLYTSFFPPIFYLLFGTSRHNSVASFSVVSLMAGVVVREVMNEQSRSSGLLTNITTTTTTTQGSIGDPYRTLSPVLIASTLAFTVGLVQIMMGLLRLEIITTYFSDQVVAGFTTGASCHMFAAQLNDLFGIYDLPKRFGAGNFFFKIYDIGANLYRSNYCTMAMAFSSSLFLFTGKELISPIVKKRCKMPIQLPIELILVIITTIASFFFDLHKNYGVEIVGKIPTGMPMPQVPEFNLIPRLLPDAVSIAVVVVAIHISLAKLFAKKLRYDIDPGQELYALGLTSSMSGFFPVYPISCSLSGTMVNVEAGSKTRVSTIFTCLFVLSIILYIGQWLETLPMCVLSVILIYALKGMAQKFSDLRVLWLLSKIDFAIWIVSFLATICWNLTEGLLFSICFALLTTVLRTAWPKWHFLANLRASEDYKDAERYKDIIHFDGICIFRFDAPLLFTNVENFKNSIYKALKRWEESSKKRPVKKASKKLSAPLKLVIPFGESFHEKSINHVELINEDDDVDDKNKTTPSCGYLNKHFIIDCSGFTFVDYMGVNALKEVYGELSNENVMVYFATTKAQVRDLFESSGFYQYVSKSNFYPTIQDAVSFAKFRIENRPTSTPKARLKFDAVRELRKTQPEN